MESFQYKVLVYKTIYLLYALVEVSGVEIKNKYKIQEGLYWYKTIMDMLDTDKFCSEDFRKAFNHFYRVRQKKAQFYDVYYGIMKNYRTKPLSFKEILTEIYEGYGEVHPSFSSKLIHTFNPDLPIWDSRVLKNLGFKGVPAYKKPLEKIEIASKLYQTLCDWYEKYLNSKEGKDDIKLFDELFPDYKDISNTKKIDFILWSK